MDISTLHDVIVALDIAIQIKTSNNFSSVHKLLWFERAQFLLNCSTFTSNKIKKVRKIDAGADDKPGLFFKVDLPILWLSSIQIEGNCWNILALI